MDMEKIVSLCKRKGFIFQASEIYGGINGFWDYGPLGVELKRNIKDAWWRDMVSGHNELVKPAGAGGSHAWSLAHGAGRKWARSDARQRMRERFSAAELTQTPLGGRVVCEERDLLYEEAPAAYKNIEAVIADLVAAGLVSVIATLRPLLTYKTRKLRR